MILSGFSLILELLGPLEDLAKVLMNLLNERVWFVKFWAG